MKTLSHRSFGAVLALFACALIAFAPVGASAQQQRAYSQAELDRLLAPIALYPDNLLSQILMAATYPEDVVEAARWSRAHPGLQGDDAVRQVGYPDWDPSVRSLVAFPHLLIRMDDEFAWTRQLGDAFLVQEQQVMDTIQHLRRRAYAAGSLRPDDRLRVYEDRNAIAIELADPRVVYVPYYDPWVVYGSWWWPAYPPVTWAPWPGWVARPAPRPGVSVSFWWGPAVRVSTGFFFGAPDWHDRHVRVSPTPNYYYRPPVVVTRPPVYGRAVVPEREPQRWQHDSRRRHGGVVRPAEVQRAQPSIRMAPGAPARDPRQERRYERRDDRRDDRQNQRRGERSDVRDGDRRADQRTPVPVNGRTDSHATPRVNNRGDARANPPGPTSSEPRVAGPAVSGDRDPEELRRMGGSRP